MPANVALAAELDKTNAALAALATRVTNLEIAVKNIVAELVLDEALIAALTAPAPAPAPTPVDPQIQWKAGMETGDLSEWTAGGGGEAVNDTGCTSVASKDFARSGAWSMKQTVNAASGGARMQRYPEVNALCRAGTKFYWTWWDYFPTPISFSIYDMFAIWGWWSVQAAVQGAASDVFFGLGFHNAGMTLDMAYNPTSRPNLASKKVWTSGVPVPVGQWNKFEVELLPRGDATGSIRVWMNAALIFEVLNIQTQYPVVGQPLLSGIEQLAYGSNLTPTPYSHYVDDVVLSLGRMP